MSHTVQRPLEGSAIAVFVELGNAEAFAAEVPIVRDLVRIARLGRPASVLRAPTVTLGSETPVCFVGMSEDYAVAGVPISFEARGDIVVTASPGWGAEDITHGDSTPLVAACTAVAGLRAGRGELIARVGGVEKTETWIVTE